MDTRKLTIVVPVLEFNALEDYGLFIHLPEPRSHILKPIAINAFDFYHVTRFNRLNG